VALLSLALATLYGVVHEKLLSQDLLTPLGRHRSLLFAAIYWIAAAAMLWLAPRSLGAAAAIFAAIYTVWWSGLAAPLAVLYFFGACLLTGRILLRRADPFTAIALGIAVWLSAIWLALHYPVNTRTIYLAAFAIPYLIELRRVPDHFRSLRFDTGSRPEAAALALLLFFLLAHGLVALQPEVSDDALSMHLALPMKVAHDARWGFDFKRETWTLMPAAGDCLYTATYVLAGDEAAARLSNFALLCLIAAMIVHASRRWLSLSQSLLAAALFASTPLVQLVTGSMFVENLWAFLILAATLALVRFHESTDDADLVTAGALFGAAVSVKLMAAVFLAPAALIAAALVVRRRRFHALFSATWWMLVLGLPPYLYALVQSGNPVFPFANTIFKSPYFDIQQPFTDPRFAGLLTWHLPFDLTFHSEKFFEGQAGAAGFQYFLLLVPALLLLRRRAQWIVVAIGAGGAAILLVVLPNLRYLYPAMPLLSIALASVLAEWPRAAVAYAALAAANFWFLGASGWYHKDFAAFRKSDAALWLDQAVPERALIQRLNRDAPGEAVAFFSTDDVAGLYGPAYTDSWHNNPYWLRIVHAPTTADLAAALREFNIQYIVAPATLRVQFPLVETFLREWTEPDGPPNGRMALRKLREEGQENPRLREPLPAGEWDDLDERIEFNGAWMHDRQFPQTRNLSVSYSDVPGDWFRFRFTGDQITYIYTAAANRGAAQVIIDGQKRGIIEMFSPQTRWQASQTFDRLGAGTHTFEVRILDQKNSQSSGNFVDLDAVAVK
jgi:hypothetical protein